MARLAAGGLEQRDIAERQTVTAVCNELALDSLTRGLDSPPEAPGAPQDDYGKLRRQKSPKDRLEPDKGHQPSGL